ncbi:MAG: chromate resistance protein ChrB domain-containing protein [Clostridia bacterium]
MRWVTWEHVGIDRMGSAWLIRRYIDPRAVFHFIPPGTRPSSEQDEGFDIPGVRFSHHRGHATFHSLLVQHGIKNPSLDRIARIIDEADTAQDVFVEPIAQGLDAICRGIQMTSNSDDDALERGFMVYDALLAYLSGDVPTTDSTGPGGHA